MQNAFVFGWSYTMLSKYIIAWFFFSLILIGLMHIRTLTDTKIIFSLIKIILSIGIYHSDREKIKNCSTSEHFGRINTR